MSEDIDRRRERQIEDRSDYLCPHTTAKGENCPICTRERRRVVFEVADSLRNPLQALTGLLDDFDQTNLTPQQKERLDQIKKVSRSLKEKIFNLTELV